MKKLYIFAVLIFASSFVLAQNKQIKTDAKNTVTNLKSSAANNIDAAQGTIKTNSTATVVEYDFTTGSNKYFGGTAAAKEVAPGVWAMIAGDANSDGSVNATDYNSFWLLQNGQPYNYNTTKADFNLDGSINATDYNNFWLTNNGKVSQVP